MEASLKSAFRRVWTSLWMLEESFNRGSRAEQPAAAGAIDAAGVLLKRPLSAAVDAAVLMQRPLPGAGVVDAAAVLPKRPRPAGGVADAALPKKPPPAANFVDTAAAIPKKPPPAAG